MTPDNENICAIEDLAKSTRVPFVSIKNGGKKSELVINPNFLSGLDFRAQFQGFSSANQEWFEAICASCALCESIVRWDREVEIIDDRHQARTGLRIERSGYSSEKKSIPLYKSDTHSFSGGKDHGPRVRVCCLDDEETLIEEAFERSNTDILLVRVNPNVECSPSGLAALVETIGAWKPDWVISDKGLGYVDGIEVIRRCKAELGVKTIMYAGEIQTNETRRVADIFLEKSGLSGRALVRLTRE